MQAETEIAVVVARSLFPKHIIFSIVSKEQTLGLSGSQPFTYLLKKLQFQDS
jgi:hypothetical protein